jgi:hypothetical protein
MGAQISFSWKKRSHELQKRAASVKTKRNANTLLGGEGRFGDTQGYHLPGWIVWQLLEHFELLHPSQQFGHPEMKGNGYQQKGTGTVNVDMPHQVFTVLWNM